MATRQVTWSGHDKEDNIVTGKIDVQVSAPVAARSFGMYNNCAVTGSDGMSGGDNAANWKAIRDKHMTPKTSIRREFNTGLPAAYSGGDVAHGITAFLSFKSDFNAIKAGTAKAAIQTFAKTWPQNCYATWQHEPENTKKEFAVDPHNNFVLPFEQVYQWVKAVRPDVKFGPVHLAYQWGTSGQAFAKASQWKVNPTYADFYGIDWYSMDWNPATWDLSNATDFQQWYSTFAPTNKPLYLSEYGIEATHTDAETVTIINSSRTWVSAHPQVQMILYWNGVGMADGDFQLTPTASKPGGRPQALAAWNAWTG
jgi:hypothetical protein